MAGWLGVEVGAYHQVSDSLHMYTADAGRLSLANEALIANPDSVSLSKAEFDDVLVQFNSHIDILAKSEPSEVALRSSLASADLPASYQNLLCVVAADAARRRCWIDLSHEVMVGCTNPVLQRLWKKWLERCHTLVEDTLGRSAVLYGEDNQDRTDR